MDLFRKWREKRHNDPDYIERKKKKEEKKERERIQMELWLNNQNVRSIPSVTPSSTSRTASSAPSTTRTASTPSTTTSNSSSSSAHSSEGLRRRIQRSRELLAEQMEANAWLQSSRSAYRRPFQEVEDMMQQVRQMERMIFRQIEQIRELSRLPTLGTIEIVITDLPDDIGDTLPQLRNLENLDYETLLELLPPVNRGATTEQIQQVPSRTYTKSQQNNSPRGQTESSNQCAICFSEFEEGESVKTLPKCLHGFHTECIDKWLGINKVCPVCRTSLS